MTRKLRLLPFATFHVWAVAVVMAGTGCSGSIGGARVNGDEGGDGGGEGGRRTGGGTGQGGAGGDVVGAQCPDPQMVAPGPTPLRRLTKAEYNNTVADLLGETSQPANAFPPESRVHGFDNDVTTQTVTYTLADYTFKAAEQLASKATTRLETLVGCNPAQAGEATCAESFIRSFGLRAYRRPLTDDERESLLALYQKGKQNGDFKNGIKLVMTRMLASPHFLYRPELEGLDAGADKAYVRLSPYEMASRLSYLIWGTMPDQALFDAAAKDELRTTAQIKSHVGRMLQDQKAKAAMARFYSGWLTLHTLAQSAKDEKQFPGYGAVVPAMVEEVTRMMDDVIWGDDDSVSKLFTADYTFMNRDLAAFLNMDGASNMKTSFERVTLKPDGPASPAQRKGILASPGLLAAHSKPQETSPVLRGRFVLEQILCMELPLPPAGVPPVEAGDTSALTTRERFAKHAESECASCHKFLDPIGFAFENFDAAGRFRTTEKGKAIDTSGDLTETDVDGSFANSVELTERLARSERVRQCLATQWFRYAFGRSEVDEHEHALTQLACNFRGEDARIRSLIDNVVGNDAFLYKSTSLGSK